MTVTHNWKITIRKKRKNCNFTKPDKKGFLKKTEIM